MTNGKIFGVNIISIIISGLIIRIFYSIFETISVCCEQSFDFHYRNKFTKSKTHIKHSVFVSLLSFFVIIVIIIFFKERHKL